VVTHRHPAVYIAVAIAIAGAPALGCVHRTPDPSVQATISGNVREPDAPRAVAGREVVAIDAVTGRVRQTKTGSSGGFTFVVPPGTYRLNVILRNPEVLSNWPNPIVVDAGDIRADADLVIAAHPR
jgi:Carboxypeptidase regulatory-like domain